MKNKLILVGLGLVLASSAFALKGNFAHNHDHSDGNFSHSQNEVLEHSGGLDQCGGHNNTKTGTYHYHRTPKC